MTVLINSTVIKHARHNVNMKITPLIILKKSYYCYYCPADFKNEIIISV